MTPVKGDIIYAARGPYNHCGIYVDKNRVIHYATDDDSFDASKSYVHITTLKKFAKGDDVYKLNFPETEREWEKMGQAIGKLDSSPISFEGVVTLPPNPLKILYGVKLLGNFLFGHGNDDNLRLYSPEETVKRATNRLGERKYSLLFNNCEHFAIWCKIGLSKSEQIEDLLSILKMEFNPPLVIRF